MIIIEIACLIIQVVFRRDMTQLRSYAHRIYGEVMKKIALSPLDTKRYILEDGCATLAFGQKDIPKGFADLRIIEKDCGR